MKVLSASFSLTGPKGSNDDRVLLPVTTDEGYLAAIADGVGGNAGGGRAAELTLDTIARCFKTSGTLGQECLAHVRQSLSRDVILNPQHERMATTLSAVILTDGVARTFHVGDTRIYHLRSNGLQTKTEDQTEVAYLIKQGVLRRNQARGYPRRNVLLEYFSPNRIPKFHTQTFDIKYGDHIILMSDGAYELLEKRRIVEIARSSANVEMLCNRLRADIEGSALKDDASAIAIRIT